MLPRAARKRVTIEAESPFGWERYAGDEGAIMGIDHYGASAPGEEVLKRFGFTVDRVAEIARKVVRDGLHGRIPTLEPGHLPAHQAAHAEGGSADPGGEGPERAQANAEAQRAGSGVDRDPKRGTDPGHD